jgi:anti-anti-sigma factor
MERASEGAGGIGRGDHACLVCETDAERWSAVEEFARAGVVRGERMLYVARAGDEEEAQRRLGALDSAGAGELVVVPAAIAMAFADGARFDPAERDAAWREQVRAALGEGFTGLSVASDVAWFNEAGLSLGQILDYEHRCTGVIDELPASALCVYDRGCFDDRTLARAGHAHPVCRGRGVSPAGMFVSRTMAIAAAGPGALRLSGEVDISNVPSLSSALRSTAGGRSALLLDMGALDFIDVAGMRAIQRTAQGLAARGGELMVLSPRPLVARMITMMGMDGLVRTERTH